MTAHHALGLAYGAAPWGREQGRQPPADATRPDGKHSRALECRRPVETRGVGRGLEDARGTRLPAAQRLAREIARFVDGPRPHYQSRLAPLFELVEILSPAWDKETDPEMFRA